MERIGLYSEHVYLNEGYMTQTLEHTQVGGRVDLTATWTIKAGQTLPYGQVEFIVSNSATDRYGESIVMEGINTEKYMSNPVVLWGHDYNALPLGRTLRLRKDGGNLIALVQFDTDLSEFANTVYQQILRGTISAASIGGLVQSYGLNEDNTTDWATIAELEMVEWSVVAVPANPEALVLSKAFGIEEQELKKQYIDFVASAIIKTSKEFGSEEILNQIQTLENLASVLRGTLVTSNDSGGVLVEQQLKTRYTIAKTMQQTSEKIVVRLKTELKDAKNVRITSRGNL